MEKKYALFIDGDNISPSFLESIILEVSKDGDILTKRLYGDWTTPNMNGWKSRLEKVPIRPVQQFRNGPNATDNTIIMDAIELANTNKGINAVCIVSTDSDYYSLALRLREYGIYVLGIGRENAKAMWVSACNEFKYLENLDEEDSNDESVNAPEKSPEALINAAYRNSNMDADGWVSLAHLGKSIRSVKPEFDTRSYNHNTLRELIEALSDDYELKSDNLVPPNYWVKYHLRKHSAKKVEGKIKKVSSRFGFIEYEKQDFFFSFTNILKEHRNKTIKAGTRVRFSIFKMPNPKASNPSDKNGKAADIEII